MKKTLAIIALLSLLSLNAQSQKTATWKGGTPGKSTDWNCPGNWKEGRVPNEFSHVVIPDVSSSTFSYPVIDSEIEIWSIEYAPTTRVKVLDKAHLYAIQQDRAESGLTNLSPAQANRVSFLRN
ncbi:MAG: hypothetical protein ACKVU0_09360 [Saprospiraceae bacterium]